MNILCVNNITKMFCIRYICIIYNIHTLDPWNTCNNSSYKCAYLCYLLFLHINIYNNKVRKHLSKWREIYLSKTYKQNCDCYKPTPDKNSFVEILTTFTSLVKNVNSICEFSGGGYWRNTPPPKKRPILIINIFVH